MAEPTTIIGEFTSVHGNLQGDEDLVVLGRVDGSIQLERTLVVEPSGVVKADVSVRNAVVSGIVVGNIEASESVQLTAEGRMVGDIVSPRVIIVEGALFRGRVEMDDAASPRETEVKETPVEKPAPARRAPSRSTSRSTASRPAARSSRSSSTRRPAARAAKEEAPKPKPARGRAAAKPEPAPEPEAPEEVKAKETEEEAAPPPPKPRVAAKKRRVNVRKK